MKPPFFCYDLKPSMDDIPYFSTEYFQGQPIFLTNSSCIDKVVDGRIIQGKKDPAAETQGKKGRFIWTLFK